MNTLTVPTAILIFDWWTPDASQAQLADVRSLLPLVDKPLLQRVIEQLVKNGCREFHVLLDEHPTPIREFLGVGERWGVKITHHYRNTELDLAKNLKHLQLASAPHYWLVCPDKLPEEANTDQLLNVPSKVGAAWCYSHEDQVKWTGWACVTGAWLASVSQARTFSELEQLIQQDAHLSRLNTPEPLSVVTDADLLQSSLRVLKQRLAHAGQSSMTGRGALVDPSVQITDPVYIGRQACIKAGVKLGPNVIVCDGAFVDQDAELSNCVVLPDTYVGTHLELNTAIAAPGKLSSVSNNVVLDRVEASFLASASGRNAPAQRASHSPVTAWIIKVVLFPLYLLIRLIGWAGGVQAPLSQQTELPSLSTGGGDAQSATLPIANTLGDIYAERRGAFVAHFLHTFYAGLGQVAQGRITLYGPELRSAEAVTELPAYWQALYQQHRCGLLSESLLQPIDPANHGGHYAYDAYAVTDNSARYQYSILWRYLGRVGHDCYKTLVQNH